MSKTAHTPGPWVWRGKSGTLHQVGTAPYAYGGIVLEPNYEYDSGLDTKVNDADAALIAAAPEMLAALKAVELARNTDSEADWLTATKLTDAALSKAGAVA